MIFLRHFFYKREDSMEIRLNKIHFSCSVDEILESLNMGKRATEIRR